MFEHPQKRLLSGAEGRIGEMPSWIGGRWMYRYGLRFDGDSPPVKFTKQDTGTTAPKGSGQTVNIDNCDLVWEVYRVAIRAFPEQQSLSLAPTSLFVLLFDRIFQHNIPTQKHRFIIPCCSPHTHKPDKKLLISIRITRAGRPNQII